jgi:UDP-N-acetylglucosamine 1-carboxyvinyltransferase
VQLNDAYEVEGGRPLSGSIRALGAKNFATKAMIAAILADGPTTLTNMPPIGDVEITVEMLEAIGVSITWDQAGGTMILDPSFINSTHIPMPQSGANRMPILLLSALLSKFGEATVPVLGGCTIGARTVDFHINAIERFGGIVEVFDSDIRAKRSGGLTATQVDLPYPSVGATETSLYLAVLAKGDTSISNAAIEPEIMALISMLRAMGAVIFTDSGRHIQVRGVGGLRGIEMEILGDRVEVASLACLACATGGEIEVHGAPVDALGNFLSHYREVGGDYDLLGSDALRFYRGDSLRSTVIETDVSPGFSTDWQQPFAVLLTQAAGASIIHETVYENRFGYLKALNVLGAETQVTNHCLGSVPCRYRNSNCEHSAMIVGGTTFLGGQTIEIPDLRAGLAYVIAAAIADGTTTLLNTHFVERGYGDLVERLGSLDLAIRRVPYAPDT